MSRGNVQRNSKGLRDALFDEIDAFRRGEGDPERAIAVSKLASQIIAAAKLDVEFAKSKAVSGSDPKAVPLGNDVIEQRPALPPSEIKPPSKDKLMGGRA